MFQLPLVYPILDTAILATRDCAPLDAAEGLIEGCVKILQYRHKQSWTQLEFDQAKQIAGLCREAGVLFVLNDRADFAQLLTAGLHLGQRDLPPVAARRIVPDAPMGFSTHNKPQLLRANDEPVEYLSLGPIFPTTSKLKPDPTLGVEGLRTLRPLAKKPLVAIGGINLENAAEVIKAGADSLAVIAALLPERCTRSVIRKRAEEWMRLVPK